MDKNTFEKLITPYVEKIVVEGGLVDYRMKQKPRMKNITLVDNKQTSAYKRSNPVITPYGQFPSVTAAWEHIKKYEKTTTYQTIRNRCGKQIKGYSYIPKDE